MKIGCYCGEVIHDGTDYLPHKAHVVADQDWFDLLDAIDDAVERSGPTPLEKADACMRVRRMICELTRSAYQCSACGRLCVEKGATDLSWFVAAGPSTGRSVLSSVRR
jgi:hypothetical protein